MATESDTKTETENETPEEEPKDAAAEEQDTPDEPEAEETGADGKEDGKEAQEERGGWGIGAAAVVSAGLGLASLTGTSLSEMFRERKQLIGQIESSSQQGGGGGDAVDAVYGAPWHATAMINGIFALLAVVVGGVLLAALANRPGARPWVKAVCVGGLVLGAIGLLVAGGMYFDLFASQPDAPTQPTPPPAQ